jgi:two-component system response regulator BaeR
VVEDDRRTAEVIALYLRHAGHVVSVEHDGLAAMARARGEPFDLVILDRMLPGAEGLTICRALREQRGIPVIMVTARTLEEDRLAGFDAGADDYVSKPFSPRELAARVSALLRRTPPESEWKRKCGAFEIDLARRVVAVDGLPIELTPSEFSLLEALIERPGVVRSRMALLDALPHGGDAQARTIDAHIRNLRRKLAAISPEARDQLETVTGVGYRLSARRNA